MNFDPFTRFKTMARDSAKNTPLDFKNVPGADHALTAITKFCSRAGWLGLTLIISTFMAGASLAADPAALPGRVNSGGKSIPFVTWLDSIWVDHLVARAATIYDSPALAEAFYRDALRIAPNSARIVEQIAKLYHRQNLAPMNHALSMYGRILNPEVSGWDEILASMPDPSTLAVSGKNGLDYEIPLSKKASRQYGEFKALSDSGDFLAGELILRDLMAGHPGDLRFLMDFGILCSQHNDWGMAAAIFSYAHEIYPDHFSTTFNLCQALGKIGLSEQALLILQERLDQKPNDLDLLGTTCRLALAMGRYDETFELAKRWISISPDTSDAHNCLARVLLETGRFADADTRLAASLKLEPHRTETILLKIQTEVRLGHVDEARKRFADLVPDMNPDELQVLVKRAPYNQIPDIDSLLPDTRDKGVNP